MLNAVLITNNIHFNKKLLDELKTLKLDISIGGIGTTKFEVLTLLGKSDFDLIFLDKSLESIYSKSLLSSYSTNIFSISLKENSKMICPRYINVLETLKNKQDLEIKKCKIIEQLEFLGYKFKYKGTHYLLDTILLMFLNQDSLVDNLQSNIYPIIANKYNKTIINIKSSINKATECMYYECDSTKLARYFQFPTDAKPTVKQVVFTIINKINIPSTQNMNSLVV